MPSIDSWELAEKFLIVLVVIAIICGFLGLVALVVAPGGYSLPIAATENPIGSKIGEAQDHTYFFIFGDSSDASIYNACKNGGITKISTVDYKMKNLMFIKQTYTVVVSGE